MNLIQIIAFLSVLQAFGVPQPTIDQIHLILQPATTTQAINYVPVTTSPITENQPVYFGSTAPVIPTPTQTTTTPVVQSVPMDKSDIVINEVRQRPADAKANQPFGSVQIFVSVLNPAGNETEAEVTMDAPDNIYGVLTGKAQRVDPYKNEWRFGAIYVPTSGGTKTVTFTSGALTKTTEVTF